MTKRSATRQTQVVNRRTSKFDVNIARPSKWGNIFTHLKRTNSKLIQVPSREAAVDHYREYLIFERHDLLVQLPELFGMRLGCWCEPELCHGDVLIELIDLYQSGRICQQCGCSDNSACEDGCCWFEAGLCSVCATNPDHGPEIHLYG